MLHCCRFLEPFSIRVLWPVGPWISVRTFGSMVEKFPLAQQWKRDIWIVADHLQAPEDCLGDPPVGVTKAVLNTDGLAPGGPLLSSSRICQRRVSRPLGAHWLCLSQILYSVEQKVHDVLKSTKNL